MFRLSIWMVVPALAGCFDNIEPDNPEPGVASEKYTTTRGADGSYTTLVDATTATDWVYGDFETGSEVALTAPWDLRFQRFHISTNGGASGTGGVEVARVNGQSFAQLTSPPTEGWVSDAPDGDDANTEPEYAFDQDGGWYEYDPMTHVLTPKPLVWVVKTAGTAMIKLEITSYYDDAGTAGRLTLHWRPL
jgi:hypothetical protein